MDKKPTYEELAEKVKQLEEELEKSGLLQTDLHQFAAAFRMLADHLEDMVSSFHIPSKKFVYINQKVVDFYGIREDRK